MPSNSLISTRPNFELVTRYGASWMIPVLNASNGSGIPTIDLYGNEATATNFFSNIEAQDPFLVNLMGHGNYNLITGQNGETLLVGGVNDESLAGRVIYALSCRAGRDLGASAVSKGAVSFLGYTEDFFVGMTEGGHPDGGMLEPLQDEVARAFFESHNVAPISYINGSTTINSYYASQKRFNYWINVWENVDSGVASLLMWNRDHQILHPFGPAPPTGKLLPVLAMFAPLLLIPLSKKFK